MAIHVDAAYYLCRAVLPLMRPNRDGAIILVSSVAGLRGVPGALAYATAKGAILQFTRSLARDVADDNIRVNCVAPGVIRTRFHEKMTPEAQAHNLAVRIPLHREGHAGRRRRGRPPLGHEPVHHRRNDRRRRRNDDAGGALGGSVVVVAFKAAAALRLDDHDRHHGWRWRN